MRLVTRAQWRARPRGSGAATPFDPLGVTVHWVGAGWPWPWDHDTCDDKMRAMQADHMDNRGWSDIGYNFVACPHGWVFEGRGLNRRSAANGYHQVNTDWYAVQCMWGSRSGPATRDLLTACRDAIDYCRGPGSAGNELRGHRDHKQTDCPGDQLYAWTRNGAPRPQPTPPPEDPEMTQAQVDEIKNHVTSQLTSQFASLRRDLGVHIDAEVGRDEAELQRDQSQRTDLGVQFTAVHEKLDTLVQRTEPPAA